CPVWVPERVERDRGRATFAHCVFSAVSMAFARAERLWGSAVVCAGLRRAAAAVCRLRRRAVCPCGAKLWPARGGAGMHLAFGLSGHVFLCAAHDGKHVFAF